MYLLWVMIKNIVTNFFCQLVSFKGTQKAKNKTKQNPTFQDRKWSKKIENDLTVLKI